MVVLLAQATGTGLPGSLVLFALAAVIMVAVGQVLPALIVRRSPERFLELLLPAFTTLANLAAPADGAHHRLDGGRAPPERQRRERPVGG